MNGSFNTFLNHVTELDRTFDVTRGGSADRLFFPPGNCLTTKGTKDIAFCFVLQNRKTVEEKKDYMLIFKRVFWNCYWELGYI